jgi:putative transposase
MTLHVPNDQPLNARRRNSLRAPAKDYREHGAYFVTICTHERGPIFEHIGFADLARRYWRLIPEHFPFVELDEFVIMPNHVHGIVWIIHDERVGLPTRRAGSLSTIVGSYKAIVTREINRRRNSPGMPVWQRSFCDHVVRNEKDLLRIQQYIVDNPARWAFDHENPDGEPDAIELAFLERYF